jgi:prepilin-type N-terminal cleavage/methylation domain-containing protein
MRIRCTEESEKGFSLVEVVMAIALFGVMAAGVLGSFRYGFFTLRLVRENQRATQIMLEKMETIRLYSWDQVNTTGFIPATFTDEYDPQGATTAMGTTYNGTVTVSPCSLTPTPSYAANLRQLTVTLNWTTGTIPRTRSITTYIAKDGLQNYVY